MMKAPLVVAIDGPAGAGKSTIAKLAAEALGIPYLDTGALYRALALYLDSMGIPPEESPELDLALQKVSVEISGQALLLDGKDVGGEIRSPRIDGLVSPYAALPPVRARLLDLQREQGDKLGVVADGRDMATVVFPGATVKIFLTASAEERARRRFLELQNRGESIDYHSVLKQIKDRDRVDSEREAAPLRKAEDGVELSTDGLTIAEVVDRVLAFVKQSRQGGRTS